MKRVGLIAELSNSSSVSKNLAKIAKQINIEYVTISINDIKIPFIQFDNIDCWLIFLTNESVSSDEFRDICREIRFWGKPIYLMANRLEIEKPSFQTPFHLQYLAYFDLNHPRCWQTLKSHLLDLNVPQINDAAIFSLPDHAFLSEIGSVNQSHPITSVQNLRRAWLKIWNYSKTDTTYFDALSFTLYHDRLDANLIVLSDLLQSKQFVLQPLFCISVPKVSLDEAAEDLRSPNTRACYELQNGISAMLIG